MNETTEPAMSGTGPSEALLKNPELHNANTAAPVPGPFRPAPWWCCLFRRWEEPEFVRTVRCWYRNEKSTEWTGSFYRQRNRNTGRYRYYVVGQFKAFAIDAGAYEREGKLVFV